MASRHDTQSFTPPPVVTADDRVRAVARHEAVSVAMEHENECVKNGAP